jgi:excisionase family DNA binding protein
MSNTILTISDLSKYLHIHRTTIYRMLREGRLPGFRIGSDWRFSHDAIEQWLRDQIKPDIESRDVHSPVAPPSPVHHHGFGTGDSPLESLQSRPSSLRRSAKPGRARRPKRSPGRASLGPSRKINKSEDECTEVNPSSHKTLKII